MTAAGTAGTAWAAALAALAAGAGVAMLLPPGPGRLDGLLGLAEEPGRAPSGAHLRRAILLGGAVAAGLTVGWAWLTPGTVALAALAVAAAGLAARTVRGRRTARVAEVRRQRVVELCVAVRAELAAGLTPAAALTRAADEWGHVRPAARIAEQGGDVAAALRGLADAPGAEALRIVAAAWQVAHRTGTGLAAALERVAADLRAGQRTSRIVAGELASARATARLLAVLPVLALAMGSGAGGDPWGFLLGEPAGIACLAAGLGLTAAGLAWIDALARAVERAA